MPQGDPTKRLRPLLAHVCVADASGTEQDVIEFLKVELAAVTVGFLVTILVTREFRGA
jgi:hypothetical protein